MGTVSTIVTLLASFDSALTVPTAGNLAVLLRGAVLSTGPRTVTGCLLAAWPWVRKHWSAYANVVRRARMNLLVLARKLFELVVALVPPESVIELVVDESLVRRYGPRVVGIGMHRDAVRSSHGCHAVTPGHKWVVVSVVIRLPFMRRAVALPVLSALYTPARHARRNRSRALYRRHRTVGELALLLVRLVVRWAPGRRFRLIGDGTYGTHDLADALNPASRHESLRGVSLVSRFSLDAAIYAPAPPYSGCGRPRVKGHKLPSPREVAADPDTDWTRLNVAWYGGTRKDVLVCSGTGRWYRRGSAATPVRWVLVRDPDGRRGDEVFFTTDLTLSSQQIIETFVRRWGQETTFQEARALLGLETLRNRSANAVRRSVPLLLGVYSLIAVWFAQHVRTPHDYKRSTPWYSKDCVTFSDMLAAARHDILREILSSRGRPETAESKLTPWPQDHIYTPLHHIRSSA